MGVDGEPDRPQCAGARPPAAGAPMTCPIDATPEAAALMAEIGYRCLLPHGLRARCARFARRGLETARPLGNTECWLGHGGGRGGLSGTVLDGCVRRDASPRSPRPPRRGPDVGGGAGATLAACDQQPGVRGAVLRALRRSGGATASASPRWRRPRGRGSSCHFCSGGSIIRTASRAASRAGRRVEGVRARGGAAVGPRRRLSAGTWGARVAHGRRRSGDVEAALAAAEEAVQGDRSQAPTGPTPSRCG